MTPSKAKATTLRGCAVAALLLLALATACESRPKAPSSAEATSASAPRPSSGAQPTASSRAKPEKRDEEAPLEFVEVLTGGAEAADPLPLIVAIHGLGDSPRGFSGVLGGFDKAARVLLPAGLSRHGPGYSWFPYRRGRSEEELARGIAQAADRVAEFLRWARTAKRTVGKPLITGFSQGGMLSFAVAVRHPDLIAAAFPVGGALPAPLMPEAAPPKGAPPIVAFHGEADPVVPFEPTSAAVTQLSELGYSATLDSYPGVTHAIPPAMRKKLHAALGEAVSSLRRGASPGAPPG